MVKIFNFHHITPLAKYFHTEFYFSHTTVVIHIVTIVPLSDIPYRLTFLTIPICDLTLEIDQVVTFGILRILTSNIETAVVFSCARL